MSRREDIFNSIWHDPDFVEFSADAKLLYLWSFTNPRCNLAGLYKEVATPIVAVETGLPAERLEQAWGQLANVRFVLRQEGLIWVRSRVKHLSAKNANVARAVHKDLAQIKPEDHPLIAAWWHENNAITWLSEGAEAKEFHRSLSGRFGKPEGQGSGSSSVSVLKSVS